MRLTTFLLIIALVFCVTTPKAESKTMTMVVDGKPVITITVSEDDTKEDDTKTETEEEPDCE